MKSIDFFLKWKFPLFLGVVLSVLYLHFFENRAHVELDITVTQKSWFSIYWAADGEPFSRWREVRLRMTPKQQKYHFYATDLRDVNRLRIDTHDYLGKAVLRKMRISQNGYKPLEFRTKNDFSLLKPLFQIGTFLAEKKGLTIDSTGIDPQLELQLVLEKGEPRIWDTSTQLSIIFLAVFLFFFLTENYRKETNFIPLFFAASFSLIIVMAAITKENVHPDEYVHLDGGEYYKSSWLPPVVDDPAIHHTYSVYGVSRLNSPEIAYFFIGKLAQFLSNFKLTELISLRMFNVLLFGGLLLYLLKIPDARVLAAPLLISPQIWYVFSYCNSDAFALFVSFLVSCQIVLPDSLLNRYLLETKEKTNIFNVLLLGILCSLLFLLKKNYIFFIVFLVGYILWKTLFQVEQDVRKQYLKRITVIILIGLSFASVRLSADYIVNGWDRNEKLELIREELADTIYKPSTPLEKQHSFLYRKARGDTLEKLIIVDRWFEKIYRSAFGMYGYFTAVGAEAYYNILRPVGVALFVLLSLSVLFRGGISGNLLFFIFLGGSGSLIAASLYHAWTMDFQTQGRYLFPIFPMASVVLFHFRDLMESVLYKLLLTAMFLLSVYSFVFIALLQLSVMS